MLQLTFNPGLALTGFRTTRPWVERGTVSQSKSVLLSQGLNPDCLIQRPVHLNHQAWPLPPNIRNIMQPVNHMQGYSDLHAYCIFK